jgi:ABC-type antimicrobial peptide transport system permease subunit
MKPGIPRILFSSLKFYRKQVFYQVLIITLLAAVITGSLLTGNSVRSSLKKTASEHLGNTGFLISTGLRYFDPGLAGKLNDKDIKCTALLELRGSSMNPSSQKEALNINIYAVPDEFFSFHGIDSLKVDSGQVFVNEKLADYLGLKEGEDLILKFSSFSEIPADAPFAPGDGEGESVVLKTYRVLNGQQMGNFSLSISQIVPMNAFISYSGLEKYIGKKLKFNRLLVARDKETKEDKISDELRSVLSPGDIGLRIRQMTSVPGYEIISERIFIDSAFIGLTKSALPEASPVLTYLANKIENGSRSTPYSFISAIPSSITGEVLSDRGIIINQWLSEDLKAASGDTLKLTWYAPDSLNHLIEKTGSFRVEKVTDIKGIWSDPSLMPDFPGIAGTESCSQWDAGVPIKMNAIRDKDEDYWKKFRGTPKAFISYDTGKQLWGNLYGSATSIRFPQGVSSEEIKQALAGRIDPSGSGFFITDISGESMKAAEEGVDFSTLFLSMGFFLVLAAIVLLSFAVNFYFDLKSRDIRIFHSLGFSNKMITWLVFLESALTGLAGCIAGAFAGHLFNVVIIKSLNSIWQGAVQTNTLMADFAIMPVITGFTVTFVFLVIFLFIKIRKYLRGLDRKKAEYKQAALVKPNRILLILSVIASLSLLIFSQLSHEKGSATGFCAGASFLISFILLFRQLYLIRGNKPGRNIADSYYSFYPSHGVTPILFIATGIFAFIITSVNRKDFNSITDSKTSGTGGYLFWSENVIPIKQDLNQGSVRKDFGLDEDSLSGIRFEQMKRYSGNDASCLNLNHVSAPPLLGVDQQSFASEGAFSFAVKIKSDIQNPWEFLSLNPGKNTVYGIADQTVLEWGLKIAVGDTLVMRAENGQPLNIIIAAGLESSVFQGYLLLGKEAFTKYYPSASGTTVMLVAGNSGAEGLYRRVLMDRFAGYGIDLERTSDRLASFYEITNTYLTVFGVFGGLGMVTGIAGLGFVILRNYNRRKHEFALLLALGFSFRNIRKMIFSEQLVILLAGIVSGTVSSLIATLPSLKSSQDIPWKFLVIILFLIFAVGSSAVMISIRSLSEGSLIQSLKKE